MILLGGMTLYVRFHFRPDSAPGDAEVKVRLEIHPSFGRYAKVFAQSESGICRDRTFAIDDPTDAARRNRNSTSEPVDTDTQRLHKFFQQDFSRMDGVEQFASGSHSRPSMVISNFNLKSVPIAPDEADPPLVVNADAVLPLAITL